MTKPLLQIAIRLSIAWLLVSVFFFVCGEWILRALLPYLTLLTNLIAHDYTAELSISDSPTGKIIVIVATATEDIYRLKIPIAPKGTSVNGTGTLMHALVPVVILFTILFSWPAVCKKMLLHIMFGILFTLFMLAVTTPMLLAGHIEQVFHTAAQNYAGTHLAMPFMMRWVVFMEIGGIWLLPIIGAYLCINTSSFFARSIRNDKFA